MCRSLGFMLKAVCAALLHCLTMTPVNLVTMQSFAPVGNSMADIVHEGGSILKYSFIVSLFRKVECRSHVLNSYTHCTYTLDLHLYSIPSSVPVPLLYRVHPEST